MKTFGKIVGTIALIVIVACLLVACDSDRDIPGNDSPDIVGDHNPGDEPDTTESPPGDVWEDDSRDDVEEADAEQDLFEICGGYIGLWDCTCTGGSCSEGEVSIIAITPFETLKNQHTFWLEKIQPNDGTQYPFVCDWNSPPATTGNGGSFYWEEETLIIHKESFISPEIWYTKKCTPHPTD